MENVTQRRPKKWSIQNTDCLNLSNTMSEHDLRYTTDEESMLGAGLDMSAYSEGQAINSEEVMELKSQIMRLHAKLNSAHEEIINLNTENSIIRHFITNISLDEKEKTITLLKKLSKHIISPASRKTIMPKTPTSRKDTITSVAKSLTNVHISTSRTSPIHNYSTVCRKITITSRSPPMDTTNETVNT